VEAVRLTLCEAGRLGFLRCAVQGLVLLGGSFGTIEIEGGSAVGMSLAQVACRSLQFVRLERASDLRVNDSQLQALSFVGSEISELFVCGSVIACLTLSGGSCRGSIIECKLGSGSRLEDALLTALFLNDTEATGLTLRGVSLARFLCARRARFLGLKLEGVSYLSGCQLITESAEFADSDLFPRDLERQRP
jgi:hypothetical protein